MAPREEPIAGGAEAIPDRLLPAARHRTDRLPLGLQLLDRVGGLNPVASSRRALRPARRARSSCARFSARSSACGGEVRFAARPDLVVRRLEAPPERVGLRARHVGGLPPLLLQLAHLAARSPRDPRAPASASIFAQSCSWTPTFAQRCQSSASRSSCTFGVSAACAAFNRRDDLVVVLLGRQRRHRRRARSRTSRSARSAAFSDRSDRAASGSTRPAAAAAGPAPRGAPARRLRAPGLPERSAARRSRRTVTSSVSSTTMSGDEILPLAADDREILARRGKIGIGHHGARRPRPAPPGAHGGVRSGSAAPLRRRRPAGAAFGGLRRPPGAAARARAAAASAAAASASAGSSGLSAATAASRAPWRVDHVGGSSRRGLAAAMSRAAASRSTVSPRPPLGGSRSSVSRTIARARFAALLFLPRAAICSSASRSATRSTAASAVSLNSLFSATARISAWSDGSRSNAPRRAASDAAWRAIDPRT